MNRSRGEMVLILPTEDVLAEYRPSELILQLIDLTLIDLAEATIEQWIQSELRWAHPDQAQMGPLMGYDAMFGTFLCTDYSEVHCRLSLEDRRAIDQIIRQFSASFYLVACPMLDSFNMSDAQLSSLQVGWVDDSLAIRILQH